MKSKKNLPVIWNHIIIVCLIIIYEQALGYLMWLRGVFKVTNDILSVSLFYLTEIPLFYIGSFYILPYLKKSFQALLIFIVLILLSFGHFLLMQFLVGGYDYWRRDGEWSWEFGAASFIKTLWRFLYIMGLAYSYMIARVGIAKAKQAGQTVIDNLRLENENLRARVDQHGLFNTMNLVYEIVEDISPEGAEAVLLNTQMMRYALGPSDEKGYVLLEKEIDYLNNYVKLARLRTKGRVHIELIAELSGASKGLTIPPAILINFEENMFKHGALEDHTDPGRIMIKAVGNTLWMKTNNRISGEPRHHSHHMGLEMIRQRLDKSHSGKYSLETRIENGYYYLNFEIVLE